MDSKYQTSAAIGTGRFDAARQGGMDCTRPTMSDPLGQGGGRFVDGGRLGHVDQVDGAHLYHRGQFRAPSEKALINAEAFRQKQQAIDLVDDTTAGLARSLNKPQPLLDEVGGRLSRAVASLINGNGRLGEVASRILGEVPESGVSKGGTTAGSDRPPSAADMLYALLDRIEEEAERLHQLAGRVERIG